MWFFCSLRGQVSYNQATIGALQERLLQIGKTTVMIPSSIFFCDNVLYNEMNMCVCVCVLTTSFILLGT